MTTRIIAFELYNSICSKQKITESLEQFHSDLAELASRANCGDREDEWVRVTFTTQSHKNKIAEELTAEALKVRSAEKKVLNIVEQWKQTHSVGK